MISNTAKAQMIAYLNTAAAPHMEAVNATLESVKETVEGFVSDLSDEISNVTVAVSRSGGQVMITIKSELNSRSGSAFMYLHTTPHVAVYKCQTSDAGKAANRIAETLANNSEFKKYAVAFAWQFETDWLPLFYFEQSAANLAKSMVE